MEAVNNGEAASVVYDSEKMKMSFRKLQFRFFTVFKIRTNCLYIMFGIGRPVDEQKTVELTDRAVFIPVEINKSEVLHLLCFEIKYQQEAKNNAVNFKWHFLRIENNRKIL